MPDLPAMAFTSTQAIWLAVKRCESQGKADEYVRKLEAFHSCFSRPAVSKSGEGENGLIEETCKADPRLLPVGTRNGDIRLWANTEFAAFLLIDPADFKV